MPGNGRNERSKEENGITQYRKFRDQDGPSARGTKGIVLFA